MRIRTAALAALFAVGFADAQTMSIEDYEPKSTLVVPEHKVTRAKYPFVDMHNHQNIGMAKEELDRLVKDMDALNMRVMVNLSGRSGEALAKGARTAALHPRWLELKQFPKRARPPDQYPPWETLIAEQHRLFARHANTIFIDAHLGWMGGNLERLGKLLDERPNVYTEIGAVLAELGRQPRFAREWFLKHQDRVLFGKDTWAPEEYHVYFRVLETADEYFDYYRKRHAFWKMYGLDLPDEVLKKLYYKNALGILPSIDASAFPK